MFTLTGGSGNGYHLKSGDKIAVLVYDGSDIYTLDPSAYSVSGDTVTLLSTVATGCSGAAGTVQCVRVAVVIETPKTHQAGDPVLYQGTEEIQAGDPMLDSANNPKTDAGGNVLLYTVQPQRTVGETYYWNPTCSSTCTMTLNLNQKPNAGTIAITVGTITLTSADYSLANNVLTLHPTETALKNGVSTSLGATIGIIYTAPVLHEADEPVYQCTTSAAGVTSCTAASYQAAATASTQFTGTEQIQIGDPMLNGSGQVQTSGGSALLYTSQPLHAVTNTSTWSASGTGSQQIVLSEKVTSGLVVKVAGVTVAASKYSLAADGVTLTLAGSFTHNAAIAISYSAPVLHAAGEQQYGCTTSDTTGLTSCSAQPYLAGGLAKAVGDEAILNIGGEQALYTATDAVQAKQAADRLTLSDIAGNIVYFGLSQVTITLGTGNNKVVVDDGVNTGSTEIDTGNDTISGNDQFAIRRTTGNVTIKTGAGSDTVDIGSWAGFWSATGQWDWTASVSNPVGVGDRYVGVYTTGLPTQFRNSIATTHPSGADAISGTLSIDGGNQATDTVNVEDGGDGTADTGWLYSSSLGGIFGPTGVVDYDSGVGTLNIDLGNAGNTFIVYDTSPAATTTLTTGNGNDDVEVQMTHSPTFIATEGGTDDVRVGSMTVFNPGSANVWAGSTLNGILGGLTICGGAFGASDACISDDDNDHFEAFDSSSPGQRSGVLTANELSGLGTQGIWYGGFELIDLRLSDFVQNANAPPPSDSLKNTFYVQSTPANSTFHLYGGDQTPELNQYEDTIYIGATGGTTIIDGGNGNDLIGVNYDQLGNQTFTDGIQGALTLRGGYGSDTYEIGLSGDAGQPITVQDVEPDLEHLSDLNQLVIYGANLPEYYLLRANLTLGRGASSPPTRPMRTASRSRQRASSASTTTAR